MLQAFKLLLPAIIPSWRFFDTVAPSPRIEFTLLKNAEDKSEHWQEFRPRPKHLPITGMLKRMLWNPRWNESLFMVSCAERLMATPTEHSIMEIFTRINNEINRNSINIAATPYLQFRLVFLNRNGKKIQKHITYISKTYQLSGNTNL